jgi:hypothetical protein
LNDIVFNANHQDLRPSHKKSRDSFACHGLHTHPDYWLNQAACSLFLRRRATNTPPSPVNPSNAKDAGSGLATIRPKPGLLMIAPAVEDAKTTLTSATDATPGAKLTDDPLATAIAPLD